MNPDILEMYVIYDNPDDMPGQFVTRKWVKEKTLANLYSPQKWVHSTLEEARSVIPKGYTSFPRDPEHDNECVVETWLP